MASTDETIDLMDTPADHPVSASLPADAYKCLREATTGMVVDALGMAGLEGVLAGVYPIRGFEESRVLGRATTVAYAPVLPDRPKISMYEVIRRSAPGSVLVVDGKGLPHNFVGDNMGERARRRGLQAIVVFGGARDIAGYRRMGLPLYCTGPAAEPRPRGFEVAAADGPLHLGHVAVQPGDLVVADEDGVVMVPAELLSGVLDNLLTVLDVEEQLEGLIQGDAPTQEIQDVLARKKCKPLH